MLKKLSLTAAAVLVAIALGSWALDSADQRGWDRRDLKAQREAHEALEEANRIVRDNIADSAARDEKTAETINQLNTASAVRSKVLSAHLARQEKTHEEVPKSQTADLQPDVAHRPLLGHAVLDSFTVRVLNDARAGYSQAPGGAPSRADAEVEAAAITPTAITGRIFADNDLEVVRLYHDLATRHNGLVDWVIHQCVPEKPQQTPEEGNHGKPASPD